MTALAKFRDQIAIARSTGNFVVQTVDEAQAVIDEIEGPAVVTIDASKLSDAEIRELFAGKPGSVISAPPYEGDDEHA